MTMLDSITRRDFSKSEPVTDMYKRIAWSLSPDDLAKQSLAMEQMSFDPPAMPSAPLLITQESRGRRVMRRTVSCGYASEQTARAACSSAAQVIMICASVSISYSGIWRYAAGDGASDQAQRPIHASNCNPHRDCAEHPSNPRTDETSKDSRMHWNRWITRLLVIFLVILPVGPTLWDYIYPGTYARWLLANAANRFDLGDVEASRSMLERAFDLAPDISLDGNFWNQLARIEFSNDNASSDNSIWTKILRRVPDAQQRAQAAELIASLMLNRSMFKNGLSILREFLPPRARRSPSQNNLIAYLRSLANQDLEEALEEINFAMRSESNESFLDTRAWILHQLGRHDEALVDIDRSIQALLGQLKESAYAERLLNFMDEKIAESSSPEAGDASAPSESAPRDPLELKVGWALASLEEAFPLLSRTERQWIEGMSTIRYHRMKILQALDNQTLMEEDLRWLKAFSPKPLDSLH